MPRRGRFQAAIQQQRRQATSNAPSQPNNRRSRQNQQQNRLRRRRSRLGARRRLLGPMGPLNESVILEIKVKDTSFLGRGAGNITKSELWRIIENKMYVPLQEGFNAQVDSKAPKDTGRLREALKSSITQGGGSHLLQTELYQSSYKVVMNTNNIPYAKPVNRMPTEWIRHPGTHGNVSNSRRNGTLDDPEATTQWYNLIRKWARSYVKSRAAVLRQTLKAHFGGTADGMKIARKLISISDGVKNV